MGKKRYNIGLLVANITDSFSNRVSKGAMQEAKRQNVDLTIFPGKYVGLDHKYLQFDARYEYQYNVLFDHAAASELDYLIVAIGTIAYAYNDEKKKQFMDRLGDGPKLSVAAKLEGYDYLIYDNFTGILDAVRHLAEQGKKHIGMMVGDLQNMECKERYEAYRRGLDENGLEFKESYIISSDISELCRDEANELLERNPELDAVLCVNDQMANVMYDVIRARGKRIGRDVAVVGFDDQPFAAELDPPLASVRADAVFLGARSVQKAVNFLNGVEDKECYVPTKFVPRLSSNAGTEMFRLRNIDLDADRELLRSVLYDTLKEREEDNQIIRNVAEFFLEMVYKTKSELLERDADEEVFNSFLDMIDRYFAKGLFLPESVSKIYGIAESLYKWAKEKSSDVSRGYLEKIFGYYYRRISGDIMNNFRQQKYRTGDRNHIKNIFIRDTLMFEGNLRDSYSVILKRLSDVGADTGFLYIFDEPFSHMNGEELPKDIKWYFKSYCYGNETFTVPDGEQSRLPREVYSNEYLVPDRQHTFVAVDLYSGETQYGLALVEPRDENFFEELELITYQMSSAVRTIELLKGQEKMMSELHSRNLALEATSREDELTRVLNRRGFYMAADEMISKADAQQEFVVCYADMDNLKLVNDNYGHKEGDLCIKLTADTLRAAMGGDAIIGRVGGDEFVGIAPKSESCTAELMWERCKALVEEFNDSMKKVYLFGMSAGGYECTLDNSYDLQNAINKADGLLYERKANKRRSISRT